MQIQSPSLVVSIHDVAPSTQATVQEMIDDLKKSGVSCCSLLVIPHYHEKELLTTAPAFVTWLQEKQKEGHEIVLHGWSHLRPAALHERLWTRWMTQHYTRGEGEFYDLRYDEARAKLKLGKAELETAGFDVQKISGFIAPAWLLSKEAERAVVDENFFYTTRLHGVIDLRKKPPGFYRSQSMVYSVSSGWRRQVSLIWNEFLFRCAEQREWPLLRLGLHPPDWKFCQIRKHALAAVSRAVMKRSVMTYFQWMQEGA
ncbi:MAG: polysaccharide deacetylase family protein [Chthoniobacterales bacterium]|nr:polysaccharide deacetylase family protein [Chthoniobacterales bacterium]